jgi:hypothetical protein
MRPMKFFIDIHDASNDVPSRHCLARAGGARRGLPAAPAPVAAVPSSSPAPPPAEERIPAPDRPQPRVIRLDHFK